MGDPTGESDKGALRLHFDRRLMLQFRGSAITSDARLPVVARYRETVKRLCFRGDAAFANPEIYEFLEAKGIGYAIRLPANRVLQDRRGYLLKRPIAGFDRSLRAATAICRCAERLKARSRPEIAGIW